MYGLRDAALSKSKALPNGAAATNTDPIDLGHGSEAHAPGNCELLIEAPAVTLAILADGQTLTYDVEDSADGVTFAAIAKAVLVQTGATGTDPAAAATARFRLPTTVRRYVRVKATKSGAGNASGVSVTASLVF